MDCKICGARLNQINGIVYRCPGCNEWFVSDGNSVNHATKESMYSDAAFYYNRIPTEDIQHAFFLYEALGDYKDSANLKTACTKKIETSISNKKNEEIARQKKLEEEEKAKEEKQRRVKKLTKIGLIIAISVIVVIIAIFSIALCISKKKAANEAQIASALEEAQNLANNYDYEGALAIVESALKKHRKSEELKDKKTEYTETLNELKKAQAEIDTIISQAQAFADKDDFKGALDVIQKGLKKYSDSEALKEKANEYDKAIFYQEKEKVLEEAQKRAAEGDYVLAIKMVKEMQGTHSDDEECNNAISNYTIEYEKMVIAETDKLDNGGEYIAALRKIEEAESDIGTDTVLSDKAKEYENKYAEIIVEQVEGFIDGGYYVTAKNTLEPAIKELPNNTELKKENGKLKEEIKNSSVLMREMKSIADTPRETTRLTDNYGNKYNYALYNNDVKFEYLLDEKYRKFTATLYVPEGVTESGWDFYITIFTDGKLVYTSPEMKASSRPETINLDITGCNDFIIEWSMRDGTYSDRVRCLADATFSKSVEQSAEDESKEGTELTNKPVETVRIQDLTSIADTARDTTKLTDNYGNRYNSAVYNSGDKYEYLLDGKYTKFTATLYVPEGVAETGWDFYITIFTDGKLVYTSPKMLASSRPETIDLDISGCNEFTIEWSMTDGTYSDRVRCLGDAYFAP